MVTEAERKASVGSAVWTTKPTKRLVRMKKTFKPFGEREVQQLVAQGHDPDNLPDKEIIVDVPVDDHHYTVDYYRRKGLIPLSEADAVQTKESSMRSEIDRKDAEIEALKTQLAEQQALRNAAEAEGGNSTPKRQPYGKSMKKSAKAS